MRTGKISIRLFTIIALVVAVMLWGMPMAGHNDMDSVEAKTRTIKRIDNISVTLQQNKHYIMPKTLAAFMSDGTIAQVPVKWDKNAVDTTCLGKSLIYGTVAGYKKKIILTAIVKPVIVEIENMSDTALQNKSYTLPKKVHATMSNGTTSWVEVAWNTDYVDTSKPATLELHGKTKGYSGAVALVLEIVPSIQKIEAMNLTAEQNKDFVLPYSVTALMSDGSEKEVDVEWDKQYVDTKETGALSFDGTVLGYDEKVRLTVNVVPVITFVDVQKQSVWHGQAFQLPEAVMAEYSDHTVKPAKVKWEAQTVDTNVDGSKEYRGTIAGYEKSIILNLEVKAVVIGPVEAKVFLKRNAVCTLPQSVTVKLTNGITTQLNVKWDPANVNTKTEGKTIVGGTVEYNGASYKASCFVYVDETAPVVTAYEVLTPVVPQGGTIQIRAKITDALSGVASVKAYYMIEDLQLSREYILSSDGTDTGNDTWVLDMKLNEIMRNEKMRLVKIRVIDKSGNCADIDRSQLPVSSAYDFSIGGNTDDHIAPVLKSIDVAPGTYKPGEDIKFIAEVADDKSGVAEVQIAFKNPENQFEFILPMEYSGTGTQWIYHYKVNGYEMSGNWSIGAVYCFDKDGNESIYSSFLNPVVGKSFAIDCGKTDNTAPRLESVTVTPSSADSGTTIYIRVKATDDSSGVADIYLTYMDPSGSIFNFTKMIYNQSLGLWEITFTPKSNDIKGLWKLKSVEVADAAHNDKIYTRDMIPGTSPGDFVVK